MAKPLIISNPQIGIGSSPHLGIGDVRNLDLFKIPGVAVLNNLLAKKSGTTVTGLIQWMVKNPTTPAQVYALDNAGVLYKSTDSGATWALVTGNTVTVTIASPAVFSATAHGLLENDTVVFATTGALPTGLTAGTTYYVIAAGLTADAFEVSTSQGGAAVNTSGSQSGTHTFRITTNANGNGLAIWKDYLFVARNGYLDVYGSLTSGLTWTNNWKAIDSDALWHPMINSKNDNKLYGGADKYVFSLDEASGQTYAPATAASYTWTSQALDLPSSYRVKCLAELGDYLMIGTWQGTNIYDLEIADIFPWDRSSSSFIKPVQLNENGINAMLTIGNVLYVLAGIGGTIYKTDGINVYPIAQIPNSISDLSGGKYLETYPGAIINYKGRLFFGISGGGTNAIDGMGVWSLKETSKGTILNLEHVISSGNYGASNVLKIGSLLKMSRDELLAGWRDSSNYGIDLTTNTSYVTSYAGYFESPLYQVGTILKPRTFSQLDLQLVKELAANEGVIVKYRVNLTDSFTTIGTYDFTALGAVISHNAACKIPACEFIQISCSLTGSTTSPEFKNLILS